MAGSTLEDRLSYTALGKVINSVRPGIPDPLPPQFRDKNKSAGVRTEYRGKGVRSIRVSGQRKTAQRTEYGSPAIRTKQLSLEDVSMVMLHSFHELEPFDWLLLKRLRSYEAYEQNGASQEVARQLEGFADLFENLEIAATMQALVTGLLYFDGDGNLLPSSSGATVTVDIGRPPAANRDQVNGIIGTSWANAAADIAMDVRQIKLQVLQNTGYRLKYAFYGKNIPGYIFANTLLQNYFVRNPQINERFTKSNEIGDFLDLIWVPIWEGFYVDSSDTVQETIGGDAVIFTPEPASDWWEFATGSFGVPKTFNPFADGKAAFDSVEEVFGRFSYAVPNHNPPSVLPYAGDTFIPWIKVPSAVIQADVVP